ncbi:hypothetical protein ACWDD9_20650 [Kitasatospora sp. NPDC001119]
MFNIGGRVDTSGVCRPVPRAARVLVVLAMLCTAPALVWAAASGGTFLDGPLMLGSLVTPVPLLARSADNFRAACRVTGWGVLALSAVGFLFGLFVLAPVGIVLLAAASRSCPGSRRLPLLVGTLVPVVTLGLAGWVFGPLLIGPYFREPDAFLATVREGSSLLGPSLPAELLVDGSGLGHGATSVSVGQTGGVPGGTLTVVFAPRTPAADLAVLRQRIAGLPGVGDVRLCNPPAHNCR